MSKWEPTEEQCGTAEAMRSVGAGWRPTLMAAVGPEVDALRAEVAKLGAMLAGRDKTIDSLCSTDVELRGHLEEYAAECKSLRAEVARMQEHTPRPLRPGASAIASLIEDCGCYCPPDRDEDSPHICLPSLAEAEWKAMLAEVARLRERPGIAAEALLSSVATATLRTCAEVAAEERERCAKECDRLSDALGDGKDELSDAEVERAFAIDYCAAAIRALGPAPAPKPAPDPASLLYVVLDQKDTPDCLFVEVEDATGHSVRVESTQREDGLWALWPFVLPSPAQPQAPAPKTDRCREALVRLREARCHEHAYGELDCHWGDCDWEGQQTPYCPCCGKDHYLHRSWDAEQQEAWRAALAALEDCK